MKILIIGGGRQLGKYLIKYIEKFNNYELTIFNRSTKNLNYHPHKFIRGDRNKNLNIFKNSHYDCVIDTCAYDQKKDHKAFDFFCNRTNKYILISSSYVNIFNNKINFNKDVPLNTKKNINAYALNKYNLEIKLKKNVKIIRSLSLFL